MAYTNQIEVTASSEECFYAIAQEVDMWWGQTDQPVSNVGDEFSIRFGPTEWRFCITEYLPFEKIHWHCIKAKHVHGQLANIEEEWLNTLLKWQIIDLGDLRQIQLHHEGLTSELNCYDVCKKGWDYYFASSLKDYLNTGIGHPSL